MKRELPTHVRELLVQRLGQALAAAYVREHETRNEDAREEPRSVKPEKR